MRAGDYQLSNIKNSNHLILRSEKCTLTPGMNIRMAIVLNNLHTSNGRVCPMPHCRSSSFVNAIGGGNTWLVFSSPDSCKLFVDAITIQIAECGSLRPASWKSGHIFKRLWTRVRMSRLRNESKGR